MISEEELIAYHAGTLAPVDRARVEAALTDDLAALRGLIEQETVDQQLHVLLGSASARERIKRSILEVVSGPSFRRVKRGVLHAVIAETDERRAVWLRGPRLWLGGALAAAACFALALWLLRTQPPESTRPTAAPAVAVAAPNFGATRDAAFQPFAATSPWNHPIGSGAIYVEADSPEFDLARGARVFASHRHRPVFVARPNDSQQRIFENGDAAPFASVRVPPEVASYPPEFPGLILIDETHRFAFDLLNVRRRDEGDLQAQACFHYDLRGTGVSAGASARLGPTDGGMPSLGGLIRKGELSREIPHALSIAVPRAALNRNRPFVWPVGGAPMIPQWLRGLSDTGNICLGTLLAIPSSVNLAELGVGDSGPAYELARTLQDFGAYVTVTLESNAVLEARGDQAVIVFCAEAAAIDEIPATLGAQLSVAVRHLKVVRNNGPDSIGGGGTPRRPLAQDFAPGP